MVMIGGDALMENEYIEELGKKVVYLDIQFESYGWPLTGVLIKELALSLGNDDSPEQIKHYEGIVGKEKLEPTDYFSILTGVDTFEVKTSLTKNLSQLEVTLGKIKFAIACIYPDLDATEVTQ
ncbi:hypothetical protein MJO29_001385 [Puccinia striiformis f. sp. tritici]|nr:hypothetical protein MJO29_001385 [Puccinia striiformis f. sp. tritici]